jgi:hypothetical protein
MKLFKPDGDGIRKRAISLIEGVLYLVVALAIIVGGTLFFQQASFNRQVNATAGMMTSVSTYVVARTKDSSMTRSDQNFETGDATTWAIKSGAVQADMIDEVNDFIQAEAIRLPWGGLVTFYEAATYVKGHRTPIIAARMNDMPPGACMRLGHKNEVGDTMIGGRVFALAVEENDFHEDDLGWTSGDVRYMAGKGVATNMSLLAEACEGGKRDLVVYYEVAGAPDTLPTIGGDADDGGFPDLGGGGDSCEPDDLGYPFCDMFGGGGGDGSCDPFTDMFCDPQCDLNPDQAFCNPDCDFDPFHPMCGPPDGWVDPWAPFECSDPNPPEKPYDPESDSWEKTPMEDPSMCTWQYILK